MKKILIEQNKNFPFDWANPDAYRDSDALRKEIYLKKQNNLTEGLFLLFDELFENRKHKLLIYDVSWWDFCLDTWNIAQDTYNYDMEGKSDESKTYLTMLKESNIELPYSGCCSCNDWNNFLHIILKCIVNHTAPYSQLFCDIENKYFFYFHDSGSIGLYYKEENDVINHILSSAYKNYIVED
jgi:hypothetical protein